VIVLAVDPQKDKSALATFKIHIDPRPGYELCRLEMVGPGVASAYNAMAMVIIHYDREDIWKLFVEGQFFHRKKNNPSTLISLVEARRDWENAAIFLNAGREPGEPRSLVTEIVPPSTWQQTMLGGGSRETLFRRAQMVFRDRFGDGWRRTNEHMRDAALIGAWACERILWEMRQKGE